MSQWYQLQGLLEADSQQRLGRLVMILCIVHTRVYSQDTQDDRTCVNGSEEENVKVDGSERCFSS